ncbi:hypothetical protein F6A46_09390 [Tenacibaculum finnmarkense genomovar ulcerans]|uniref:Uncharacterized protein n=1 Tax=Tenacibaculum finnmarkense genomovar ulcerans TaxID=2781388 RepID=A0A2I2MC24_9FLAO|nr:hypothetical protein [Tenacibaculum finnmarkense]MBE7688448.1 hypothetical protein [Tenacibaculum finnmarkense genomovar ulcerans]SOU89474.1 conserved hypothetical protein [Tenacibaculum finnmarkense genomovar ulcerans]
MSKIKIESIGGPTGCEVSGAFSHTEVFIAFLEDFETVNAPKKRCGPDAAVKLEDLVTITESHVFKTGCGFTQYKAIEQTVGLETNQIGDPTKSPVQENKLTLQLLGSKPELLGAKRQLKGRELIVCVPEFGSGNMRQVGSAKYAAKLTESSSKIEQASEGENTTTFVFTDKQMYDAPIYKGDIDKQPVN